MIVPTTATPGMFDQTYGQVVTPLVPQVRNGVGLGTEVSWHGRLPFDTVRDALGAPSRSDYVDEQFILDWHHQFDVLGTAIGAGQVDDARRIIVDELKPRINGCQANGRADADDWITSCRAQEKATASLNDLLMMLTTP